MNHKKSKVLKAYAHNTKFNVNPIGLDATDVKAQVAYNMALDMVIDFIEKVEKGEVNDEYINQIVERYEHRDK